MRYADIAKELDRSLDSIKKKAARLDDSPGVNKGYETRKEAKIRRVLSKYKTAAKKRNLKFELDFKDFKQLIFRECSYCGRKNVNLLDDSRFEEPLSYNGIDRVENDKGYTHKNVVPCCGTCNRMKRALSRSEFINHCQRIVQNLENE